MCFKLAKLGVNQGRNVMGLNLRWLDCCSIKGEIFMGRILIVLSAITLPLLFSNPTYASTVNTAVTINGQSWAQVTDTLNVGALEMEALCGTVGSGCNGTTTGGVDITGWTWASDTQVRGLINELVPPSPLGTTGRDTNNWFSYFNSTDVDEGIPFTIGYPSEIMSGKSGFLIAQNCTEAMNCYPYFSGLGFLSSAEGVYFPENPNFGPNHIYDAGYFLYSDVSAVPIPAAAFMFGPALLGFLGFRRKMQA